MDIEFYLKSKGDNYVKIYQFLAVLLWRYQYCFVFEIFCDFQDPKNKQFMLCDDQLLKVFGKFSDNLSRIRALSHPFVNGAQTLAIMKTNITIAAFVKKKKKTYLSFEKFQITVVIDEIS